MRWLGALVLALLPMTAYAQTDARIRARTVEEFLARARVAAAAFVDRDAALMDGYRPIGAELPTMGQHWLNPEYANSGYVDPDKPAFLLYVTINGKPQLGGVGYTLALQPGEKLPNIPSASAWHEHAGSVADETFTLVHKSDDDESRFRVVALHIWHALKPPDDLFAAENWNLPFYRNGLTPPTDVSHNTARVLALTHGGDAHYAEMLRRHASLSEATHANVTAVVKRYAELANTWVAAARSGSLDVQRLEVAYDAMWVELAASATDVERSALLDVKAKWQNAHRNHH